MPAEIHCSTCYTRLRVAQLNLGKLVRCPNCGGLTPIYSGDHVDDPPNCPAEKNLAELESAASADSDHAGQFSSGTGFEDFTPPANNQVAATWPRQTALPATPRSIDRLSNGAASIAIGIGGILFSFSCGCLVPVLLSFNSLGLMLGLRASGAIRWIGVLTNVLALLLELFVVWWYLA